MNEPNIPDQTPILVGAAQLTLRDEPVADATPADLLQRIAGEAMSDSGRAEEVRNDIDAIVAMRSVAEIIDPLKAFWPGNIGAVLAERWGLADCGCYKSATGGNAPQFLINELAEKLARGEHRTVLIAGLELLHTLTRGLAGGKGFGHWAGEPRQSALEPWAERAGSNAVELAHGLFEPVNNYALFENALRHHKGRSFAEHQRIIGGLFSAMSKVAASNPAAWFPHPRSVEELVTVDDNNRYVAYPYTKYLCAVIRVDMGAAVVMTTAGNARALGIDRDRWIFLNGCGDVNDVWHVSERPNFHESRAMEIAADSALEMAGTGIDDVACLDLYSCFPSAVEMAQAALGLSADDPRPLTVTGGLPYFGGPGNNYPLHAVATMMDKLRADPGAAGLVTGNGWHLTKQSVGIYSTEPSGGPWQRVGPATLQQKIDGQPHPRLDESPTGKGTVETYTVTHGKQGPEKGIVIGRLENGRRFVANTEERLEVLETMMSEEPIGRTGEVVSQGPVNRFVFD